MAKTHYEVLGVKTESTAEEIRSAYRKLVLQHHPDRSSDPKSKSLFLAASEAYQVLGDRDRRKEYDSRLAIEKKLGERKGTVRQKASPAPRQQPTPSARLAEIKLDVNRLNTLFSRGNFVEAEILARSVLEKDARQPVPYAVLGDLARMSGNKKEAIRMYALALQYDPRNPAYQRRYDDLVEQPIAVVQSPTRAPSRSEPRQNSMFAPLFGLGLVLIACIYVIFSRENPIVPHIPFISTWTFGLIAMLFLSGAILGSCMSLDNLLDSVHSMGTTALGKMSPTVALATIAAVSFWAATAMYVVIGLIRQSFNLTTSRVIACVVAGTCLLSIAGEATGQISGVQVFVWGGNVVYIGVLCGWIVADALKTANP
ncbi:MAG TPA: DnaJ domain-containing protein [Fimbriimonadaceae bacterium]|nr:DnaJ domain-containing protein [Fimbriimonadaceae bacterium]